MNRYHFGEYYFGSLSGKDNYKIQYDENEALFKNAENFISLVEELIEDLKESGTNPELVRILKKILFVLNTFNNILILTSEAVKMTGSITFALDNLDQGSHSDDNLRRWNEKLLNYIKELKFYMDAYNKTLDQHF